MQQISQPFSFHGPTRMSHRARKAAAKKHRHRLWIEPDLLRPQYRLRVCATAVSYADPPRLDVPFRLGSELNKLIDELL